MYIKYVDMKITKFYIHPNQQYLLRIENMFNS